jgi:hypothetical protein
MILKALILALMYYNTRHIRISGTSISGTSNIGGSNNPDEQD